MTIHVGLAAKRLRATVNLGSNKKKAWLDQGGWVNQGGGLEQLRGAEQGGGLDQGRGAEQGGGLDQGRGVEQDSSGCKEVAAVICTEKLEVEEDVFGLGFLDLEVQVDSEDIFESLLDDPILSSSTADEITIVDEGDVEVSALDENENSTNLRQVIENEKKTRRFVSFANCNELRSKEMERMKLLEEVKKRVGNMEISKK